MPSLDSPVPCLCVCVYMRWENTRDGRSHSCGMWRRRELNIALNVRETETRLIETHMNGIFSSRWQTLDWRGIIWQPPPCKLHTIRHIDFFTYMRPHSPGIFLVVCVCMSVRCSPLVLVFTFTLTDALLTPEWIVRTSRELGGKERLKGNRKLDIDEGKWVYERAARNHVEGTNRKQEKQAKGRVENSGKRTQRKKRGRSNSGGKSPCRKRQI